MINNYTEFKKELYKAGFSVGGENDEGVFALSSLFGKSIKWHTDDADTDPWEFRMRVLEEQEEIAYAKLFFNKSGYITKLWYPFFLRIRRPASFEDEYYDGNMPMEAKRIYDVISSNRKVPLHIIKQELGTGKEDKSGFERSLTLLQMKMYITMCGRKRKVSMDGTPYGWYSTMFCRAEDYFDPSVFKDADSLNYETAYAKIKEQTQKLNPKAKENRIDKFITG